MNQIEPVTVDAGGGLAATQAGDQALEQLLQKFADAWNGHDVNALMSMMTEDGVFEASAGNNVNGGRCIRSFGGQQRQRRTVRRAASRARRLRGSVRTVSRCTLGQRSALCEGEPRCIRVDFHRHTERWHAGRDHGLRPVYVSERQNRRQELVPKESTTYTVISASRSRPPSNRRLSGFALGHGDFSDTSCRNRGWSLSGLNVESIRNHARVKKSRRRNVSSSCSTA